ncbi:MAG: N-acetylmuramoyl-L-alanine amidase [Clostridia bacterium]|nr:N-acetylmuramoyl-L-alanine amidase [Clostridia bacterium]
MKLCIDAGHNYSGFDTGATGNGLKEQNITFPVCQFLKNKLEQAGITVVMTRETLTQNLGTSVNSSLKKRAEISNNEKCDYFISIHCNAGGGTGTEVLILKRGGQAEQLAKPVLQSIVSRFNLRNRGVKESNLSVLRNTDCPAILVELAFIDHPSDAVLLKNQQEAFADAVFLGVMEYLGLPVSSESANIRSFLTQKWNLSHPDAVFALLDSHPYASDLYQKIYESYKRS